MLNSLLEEVVMSSLCYVWNRPFTIGIPTNSSKCTIVHLLFSQSRSPLLYTNKSAYKYLIKSLCTFTFLFFKHLVRHWIPALSGVHISFISDLTSASSTFWQWIVNFFKDWDVEIFAELKFLQCPNRCFSFIFLW